MFVTDFYEIAMSAEAEIGVDMHLDLIFSNELNQYFNYKYDYAEDVFTLNFEVNGGGASLDIVNSRSSKYSYRMNNILSKYIEESYDDIC